MDPGDRIPCPSFNEAEDGSSRFASSVRLVLEATALATRSSCERCRSPLHFEAAVQLIAIRGLVGIDNRAFGDARADEIQRKVTGHAMRFLDAEGRIAWKATPSLCQYLKDLELDADDDDDLKDDN